MKEITLKCRCGSEVQITEVELSEFETIECESCGSDNYVDCMVIVNIAETPEIYVRAEDIDEREFSSEYIS